MTQAQLSQTPHRLPYQIAYFSSQDISHPATQLQSQSLQSKGWQSSRFCSYPQIIILQIPQISIVQKLTFLSHQFKISTKIEIQSKQKQQKQWKKLGYTCMESNMNTNYQARELRTVKFNQQKVKIFKLTLFDNYHNVQNTFNQVGLIAVTVYGWPLQPKPQLTLKKKGILPPGSILDKQTLDKLRQLQYLKRQAIQNNQFQSAKQIKNQIQKLKKGVQALSILQKQKRQAIKRQDYQQAKIIYEKMKKIRGPIPRITKSSNDRYGQNIKNNKLSYNNLNNVDLSLSRNLEIYTPVVNTKNFQTSNNNKTNKSISYDINASSENLNNENQYQSSPIQKLKKKLSLYNNTKKNNKSLNIQNNRKSSTIPLNIDDIKIQPKKVNIFDQEYLLQEEKKYFNNNDQEGQNEDNVRPKQFLRRSIKQYNSQRVNNSKNLNSQEQIQNQEQHNNYSNDSLPPQCQQYFTIIPQLIFKNLFSPDKNLREHGLDKCLQLIQKVPQQSYLQKMFINAVIFIVKSMIDDKILPILLKVIDLIGLTFKQYKPQSAQISFENIKNLKSILAKVSQYLGHPNEKLKSQVQDLYIVLPKYKPTNKQLCIQTITLNQKMDRLPRTIIGKLEMLGRIIRRYPQKSTNNLKDKYADVIEFGKRFLEDKNSQVRSTAIKLLAFLGHVMGYNEMMAGVGNDLRDVTKNMIKEKYYQNVNGSTTNNNNINNKAIQNRNSTNIPVNNLKNNSPQNIKKNSSIINEQKLSNNQNKSSPSNIKKQIVNNNNKKNENSAVKSLKKSSNLINQQSKKKDSPKNNKNIISQQQFYRPINSQYTCQYCNLFDKRLQNSTFRDIHWYKSCPMLTLCLLCNQKFYKKCPRCKQAIQLERFNKHVGQKQCIPGKPLNEANRCPLCHEDIEPKKQGWVKHLVDEGCACSQRNGQ